MRSSLGRLFTAWYVSLTPLHAKRMASAIIWLKLIAGGSRKNGNDEKGSTMWRFALRLSDAANCSRQQLLQDDVVEDLDFSSAVRAFHSGEVVFVVQGQDPITVDHAREFIKKLCEATPTQLWLGGEEIDPVTGAPK